MAVGTDMNWLFDTECSVCIQQHVQVTLMLLSYLRITACKSQLLLRVLQ